MMKEKVRKLTESQNAGRVGMAFPPDYLLIAVMSLAMAWSAAGLFGPSMDPKAAEHRTEMRKSIVEAVRLLAQAGKATRTPRKRN